MESIIQILLAVLIILAQVIFKWMRGKQQSEPTKAEPAGRDRDPIGDDGWEEPVVAGPDRARARDRGHEGARRGAGPAQPWSLPAEPVLDPDAAERETVLAQAGSLIHRAQSLRDTARQDPATQAAAPAIEDHVLPRAEELRRDLAADQTSALVARARLSELSAILAAVDRLVVQRQRSPLRKEQSDADQMARACYQPVIDFARANRLGIARAHPVTLLAPFDRIIRKGFLSTSVAPLFLPPTFFEDVRRWPAMAHAIGHDVLVAIPGMDTRLRDQLGVPSQVAGTRPIDTHAQGGMPMRELVRLYGAWFQEIFCDLFGAMMMGPAYGYTMVALFARPSTPLDVTTVPVDADRRGYDVHPPRHLRVLLCARALRLMGEDQAADEIRGEWEALHGEQPALWIPTTERTIGVPMEVMEQLGDELVTGLYREPLAALGGHALSDIPGVGYGPHRAAEARRAGDSLLAGRAPAEHRARAVMAGAVLAWRQAPAREAAILALARQAIVGVSEATTRPDLHADAYTRIRGGGATEPRGALLRESLVLHTVLSPPPSVQRLPAARGRSGGGGQGFLARRSWP